MARKFFYVCAGMLMLAMSFYFGAQSVHAQAGNTIVAASTVTDGAGWPYPIVFLSSGEVLWSANRSGATWTHLGNVFSGAPTSTIRQSWGEVKERYAGPGRNGASRGGADR